LIRGLRWVLMPAVVLPIGWLLFQGLGSAPAGGSHLIGAPAPDFDLVTMDGRRLDSAELAGRPYVVNFWASWCLPACEDEHPLLLDAAERWGDDVAFVGVLFRDSPDEARDFLDRLGDGGWPNLLDPDERMAKAYGVTGPPETYFVDADGVVRAAWVGTLSADALAAGMASIVSPEAAR